MEDKSYYFYNFFINEENKWTHCIIDKCVGEEETTKKLASFHMIPSLLHNEREAPIFYRTRTLRLNPAQLIIFTNDSDIFITFPKIIEEKIKYYFGE